MNSENKMDVWSSEEVEQLIEQVKSREVLYNSLLPGYSNRTIVAAVWASVAEQMQNKTAESCTWKWTTLRSGYRRVRRHNSQSGINKKTWYYYDKLSFLENYIQDRKISASTSPSSNDGLDLDESMIIKVEEEKLEEFPTEEIDMEEPEPEPEAEVAVEPKPKKKKPNAPKDSVETKMLEYLSNRMNKTKQSSMKKFLESVALDAENLSTHAQSRFKIEVLNMLSRYQEEENVLILGTV